MKTRIMSLLGVSLLLAGCATYTGLGSQDWYMKRTAELQAAKDSGKLTEAEYQHARNEVDMIRVRYKEGGGTALSSTWCMGYWH